MNPATIVINKKTFILDFGMGVFRALGEKFNEPTLLGVQKRILSVLGEIEEDISFDQLDMLNALIMASVVPVNEGDDLTTKELDNLYLQDTKLALDILTKIMSEFVKSVKTDKPAEQAGKQKAPTRSKKTTTQTGTTSKK